MGVADPVPDQFLAGGQRFPARVDLAVGFTPQETANQINDHPHRQYGDDLAHLSGPLPRRWLHFGHLLANLLKPGKTWTDSIDLREGLLGGFPIVVKGEGGEPEIQPGLPVVRVDGDRLPEQFARLIGERHAEEVFSDRGTHLQVPGSGFQGHAEIDRGIFKFEGLKIDVTKFHQRFHPGRIFNHMLFQVVNPILDLLHQGIPRQFFLDTRHRVRRAGGAAAHPWGIHLEGRDETEDQSEQDSGNAEGYRFPFHVSTIPRKLARTPGGVKKHRQPGHGTIRFRITMQEPTQNLFGSEEMALREWLAPVTPHPFHAGQVFHWIYGRGVTDFGKMTDLPLSIRAVLNDRFRIHPPAIAGVARAADGTTKFTIRLEDGEEVESVLIPEGRRITLCISSQVGCALGCRFCLTATMGLRRNLTPGEIVGQVWSLRKHAGLFDRAFNLVLMGMGEPMCNLDSVMAALGILADQRSFATPIRRVTLSTVGHVPGIRSLARYPDRPRLAISLIATTDAQRDRLIPINRKYPIRELFSALREYPLRPKERITFEFVLMAGINDSLEEARRLARLLHGLRSKVNLIRYNRTGMGEFSPPAEYRVIRFRDRLLELGIPVSIRKRKGEEIYAACGQLALRRDVPSPGGNAAGASPDSGR